MAFQELIGQAAAKELLQRNLRAQRLPSGLLFVGPAGVGKRQYALAVAQALNCPVAPDEGCGACPSCRRIEQGEHPDVKLIAPDGAYIKIGQVREAIQFIVGVPFEGRRRVLLVERADAFNTAAANAFLKTLEEPPSHAQIILISARPDTLPATIRSRCPMVRFTPLTPAEVEQCLGRYAKRPPDDLRFLGRLAQGRPGAVIGLDLEAYRQQRRLVLELLELLSQGRTVARLLKAAGYFGKLERPEFEAVLDLLAGLLRDLTCLKAYASAADQITDTDDLLIHSDIRAKLQTLADQFTLERLHRALNRFEAIRRDLNRNINRVLALEAVLLDLTA
ncbi:MAG: DNA polymerase III subunit delta' [Chloracidobacterium sp.]|nr:DNA polymerase III subunit delta' [Chloracidobacterium sp.]MDW8216711.1 DNA polymerase III subunit delta' [Acidobacteriota bacterium]